MLIHKEQNFDEIIHPKNINWSELITTKIKLEEVVLTSTRCDARISNIQIAK